ncbi:MAG: sensor histidine kinase [bacterium]
MERFSEMIFPSSFGSIALQARGLEGRYAVFADGGKIQRVVGGLVGNAIQYTPEGGEVCIRIEQDRHWVILSVQDTGIGMNPEECGHIFDRFFRSRDSQEMARGSGLGLSIAKELIGLHGGTLTVESEAGAGSTFRMSLPASREEPDHAASHHSDCG